MALVDDILSFLRANYKPAPGEFSRFDQQRLVENLRLRDLGKGRGTKGQPAADATDLDIVEQDIAEGMRQQAMEDERRTREQFEHYTDRIKSANPAGQAAAMFVEAQNAVANFESAMLSARNILDKERRELVERDRELADFKAENRLKRPPNPPKSNWTWTLFLAVCLFGEIAINGVALSAGSEFGVLGGVVIALFYSSLSMGFAFILGIMCLPYLRHVRISYVISGAVASLLFFALIVFVNLLAATYRVILTSGKTELEAGLLAPGKVFTDPLLFASDTPSILMVCMSALVALFTAWKGLTWQDPYPGYAKIAKFRRRAHDRWIHAVEDRADDLEDIYKHHADNIRALQASLADRQQIIPQLIGHRRRLVISFNSHLKHIEDVGKYLIENYREANCETRKSAKPKYFTRKWKLDSVSQMDEPDNSDAGNPDSWTDVGEKLLAASDELNGAHRAAVTWIRHLADAESGAHVDAVVANSSAGLLLEDKADRSRLEGELS